MKATAEKVEITNKINVPSVINIDFSALCRVLVNLIDNALEATEKVVGNCRKIDCTIDVRGDYLFISIVNPLPDGVDPDEILKMKTKKVIQKTTAMVIKS